MCLVGQVLPEGWWQQGSPDSVLTNAQSATLGLSYFRGSKVHLQNEKDTSIEYLQRRTSDGTVETKFVMYYRGQMQSCDYKNKSGKYFYAHGQVIKMEFEENDDIAQRLAATMDHPYEYKMLKPEIVGTNDCIVVARIMSAPLLDAVKDVVYKGYTPQQEAMFGGDFKKFIRFERDYYIRKSDAIIIGFVERNNSGNMVNDSLCDVVEIGGPVPNVEFVLPTGSISVATTFDEFKRIDKELIAKAREQGRIGSMFEIKSRRRIVIVLMVTSFVALSAVIYTRFRRSVTPNSFGDSKRR